MSKKISIYQFFILMTLVPYGSASLFFLIPEARQDVWIAIILYSLAGILLQIMYISLYNKYPGETPITYMPKIFGKLLGSILSVLYIIFFTYEAARVFRDFLELIASFALRHTPMIVFGSVFIITIIYALYNGIENIASLAQLYFLIVIIVKILTVILVISTENLFKLYYLKPVLSEGIIKLLKESWPLITYPYGETMVLTMLYPYVIENQKIKKAAVLSILTEALFLQHSSMLFICTLGPTFATLTNFPLLQTYRLIQIGDFLSRLDIIYILLFLLGGFFKICVYLYAAVLGCSQILKLKNTKFLSIPFGIIVLITSLVIAKNYPEHIHTGQVYVVKYLYVVMFIIIPSITLLIYYIKNLIFKKKTVI